MYRGVDQCSKSSGFFNYFLSYSQGNILTITNKRLDYCKSVNLKKIKKDFFYENHQSEKNLIFENHKSLCNRGDTVFKNCLGFNKGLHLYPISKIIIFKLYNIV